MTLVLVLSAAVLVLVIERDGMGDLGFDHARLTVDRAALESIGPVFRVARDRLRHDCHSRIMAMSTRPAIRSARVSESAAWYHGAPVDYDYDYDYDYEHEHEHEHAAREDTAREDTAREDTRRARKCVRVLDSD